MQTITQTLLCSTSIFDVKIADSLSEIEKALRLRYEVFNLELNEGLQSSHETGFDSDVYDTFCDHLIVTHKESQCVVGTYRLLKKSKAEKHIGFYSENEFDIRSLKNIKGEILELGRSCIAKEFRNVAVINLLWTGIAHYLEINNISYLFGCASLHTLDEKKIIPAYSYLLKNYLADSTFHVQPLPQCSAYLTSAANDHPNLEDGFSTLPPLLKGYLRLGAKICGEPALDKEFGTTDFLIIVDKASISDRYRNRFFRQS